MSLKASCRLVECHVYMDSVFAVSLSFLHLMCILLTVTTCYEADPHLLQQRCLPIEDRPSWNRTFAFNGTSVNLTLEVSSRPSHWILNYIFGILLHERLGYQNVTFIEDDSREPIRSLHRLCLGDSSCEKLPNVHINLELWLPLGTTVNLLAPSVNDYGSLGPVSYWALFASDPHALDRLRYMNLSDNQIRSQFHQSCLKKQAYCTRSAEFSSKNSLLQYLNQTDAFPSCPDIKRNWSSPSNISLFSTHPNPVPYLSLAPQSKSPVVSQSLSPTSCRLFGSHDLYCKVASHQAVKVAWPKLETLLPLVHQLLVQMRLSQDMYDMLLSQAVKFADLPSEFDRRLNYHSVACRWLRTHPDLWKKWTDGWNRKQYLTVLGLFSMYGKWVMPHLPIYAQNAIDFVNEDSRFFNQTEYALKLYVRNLTCVREMVVNNYYDLLSHSENMQLIGMIAAVCSDSIQPIVQISDHQRQLVISPTVESVRLMEYWDSPYFFRTVPSMLVADLALVHLFDEWNWTRVAVFRKDHQILDTRLFQRNGIVVLFDIELTQDKLSYELAFQRLLEMKDVNSRIFIIEHFAKGTATVLCAAYHHGLHFDRGYVWFVNPWLEETWWEMEDVRPKQCSIDQLANMSAYTFSIGHHVMTDLYLRNNSFVQLMTDYRTYTYESVLVLATALIRLLDRFPNAISVFDHPKVTGLYRDLVADTNISVDNIQALLNHYQSTRMHSLTLPAAINQSSTPFTDFTYPRLRFNRQNERVPDFWLLKQRQSNRTVPILLFYFENKSTLKEIENIINEKRIPVLKHMEKFKEKWWGKIDWRNNQGVPSDGSLKGKNEVCTFQWISTAFGVNCSSASILFTVFLLLSIIVPCFLIFIFYYRYKFKEAERRIHQPYEDLCAELADLDINSLDLNLNRRVGQGAFGMVYGGEAKRDGRWEAVAVKATPPQATYESKMDFLSEAQLMRELDHKNVVKLFGICLQPPDGRLYLIMELLLLGDLRTYLMSHRVMAQQLPTDESICPSRLTQMAIDIAEGVAYLHDKDLVHRDLACRNCLVGSDRVVKIGDFGLTRKFTSLSSERYYRFTRNCELPIRWMAPEAVQFAVSSVHSDLWSYGIVLMEIITFGALPYDGLIEFEVIERVKQTDFSILDFLPPAALNSTVASLINQCCRHQWQHRPASMHPVIKLLADNPECIRPFLTEEPPKPDPKLHALPFLPGAGACIMSEGLLTSDGPTPSANNPTVTAVTTDNVSHTHSLSNAGSSSTRGFHCLTGSFVGAGRSSLAYCSNDLPEANAAALRMLTSEFSVSSGRRRHKTADGSVGIEKSNLLRRNQSSSSGGGDSVFALRPINKNNSSPTANLVDPNFLNSWSAIPDSVPGAESTDCDPGQSPQFHVETDRLINHTFHHQPIHLDCVNTERLPILYKQKTFGIRLPSSLISSFPISRTVIRRPQSNIQLNTLNRCQQPNGLLVSTNKSLSAENLCAHQLSDGYTYTYTKSAPEDASQYGPHCEYTNQDVNVHKHRRLLDNASHLFRSMLRPFTRFQKYSPLTDQRNVVGVSNNRAHISGPFRSSGLPTSPRSMPNRVCLYEDAPDTSQVSTSCPPLLVLAASSSVTNSHGHMYDYSGGGDGLSARCSPTNACNLPALPGSAPPASQQYNPITHFFPIHDIQISNVPSCVDSEFVRSSCPHSHIPCSTQCSQRQNKTSNPDSLTTLSSLSTPPCPNQSLRPIIEP